MPNQRQHPASLPEADLLEQCDTKRTRGSGPGGQHRNKVETAIVITHRSTGIIGQASERRSQNDNKRIAIVRLRLNLAVGFRCEIDRGEYQPSATWAARVKNGRISINANHDDFPLMLGEALDVVAASEWDASVACEVLGCSSSQLIKFLKKEPAAFAMLNRQRQVLGGSPYR